MTGKDPRSNNALAELVDAIYISDDDPVPRGDARWKRRKKRTDSLLRRTPNPKRKIGVCEARAC